MQEVRVLVWQLSEPSMALDVRVKEHMVDTVQFNALKFTTIVS